MKKLLVFLCLIVIPIITFGQSKFGNGIVVGKPYANMATVDSVKLVTGNLIHYAGGDAYASGADTVLIGDKKMYYDSSNLVVSVETGISDVVIQLGSEIYYPPIINSEGSTLINGTPVRANGIDGVTNYMTVDSAKANSIATSLATLGLITSDIANSDTGFVTNFGYVRNLNTTHLIAGTPIYLAPTGGTTNTKPTYPNEIIMLGTCTVVDNDSGIINVTVNRIERNLANQSWSFGNSSVGTYWRGGFYDFATDDANLNQGSLTQTYGTANSPYSAHATIIAGGVGSTDAGVVGLRVTGTSITDAGVRTASDADTIVPDITLMVTDSLKEAKKFIGTTTYELIEISGSPTTYAFDFNYGFAKYADNENTDFTITGIEAVGIGNATDTDFDMTLFKHGPDDWTYATTGFVPGGTVIVDSSDDLAPEDNLASGIPFAWKRTNLATFINGDGDEGIVMRIVIGTNNSVDDMDVQVTGLVESF